LKLDVRPGRLVLRCTPWNAWVIAGLLIATGMVLLGFVLRTSLIEGYPIWLKFLATGLSAGSAAAGLFILSTHPATRLTIEEPTRTLAVDRRALLHTEKKTFAYESIRSITLDQIGVGQCCLRLQLDGGDELLLPGRGSREIKILTEFSARLNWILLSET
jgi:hypothetical protein